MSLKVIYNIFTGDLQYISEADDGGGSGDFPLLTVKLMFREKFTGNGGNTFQLAGTGGFSSDVNFIFNTGSWAVGNVLNANPTHITRTSGNAAYDSTNVLTRNRITVASISATGLVTLSHNPQNGQEFYVWYFYQLSSGDKLDQYLREDFVAANEADGTSITDVPIDGKTYVRKDGAWEEVTIPTEEIVSYISSNVLLDDSSGLPSTYRRILKNTSSNDIIISVQGSDTIEGELTQVIYPGESFQLGVDGNDYKIL